MSASAEALIAFCRENSRVCPMPTFGVRCGSCCRTSGVFVEAGNHPHP